MYFCYVDESGTSALPGNTSHFVLCGISIPVCRWREADGQVGRLLTRYGIHPHSAELHTGWLLRPYVEQRRMRGFDSMDWPARRAAITSERRAELLRLQSQKAKSDYHRTKKNYRHTEPYIHLTYDERVRLVREAADLIAGWTYARLFAECIDKVNFDQNQTQSIDEQAFEQLVSRFEEYLKYRASKPNYGVLVHDNNETISRKHTLLMRRFHKQGTLSGNIERIIETPLFVDSALTSMVQVADLCSYAFRRYLEKNETDLFDRIFVRADRAGATAVGVRHLTARSCNCEICKAHQRSPMPPVSGGIP